MLTLCARLRGAFLSLLSASLLIACAKPGQPPLEAIDRRVDLERFMGDWFVIGFIPIEVPFFSEAGAHNAVESYRLGAEGVIETTYTFHEDAFDGPERRFTPKGWVHNEETNAEWRMQFLWPFDSAYLIAYLDPEYQRTIVGVPDRSYVWILSRDPHMGENEYRRMLDHARDLGYDSAMIRRVPQQWPTKGGRPSAEATPPRDR